MFRIGKAQNGTEQGHPQGGQGLYEWDGSEWEYTWESEYAVEALLFHDNILYAAVSKEALTYTAEAEICEQLIKAGE